MKYREKSPGYTSQVTIWMRPGVKKLLKRVCLEKEMTLQEAIETFALAEARRLGLPEEATAASIN